MKAFIITMAIVFTINAGRQLENCVKSHPRTPDKVSAGVDFWGLLVVAAFAAWAWVVLL